MTRPYKFVRTCIILLFLSFFYLMSCRSTRSQWTEPVIEKRSDNILAIAGDENKILLVSYRKKSYLNGKGTPFEKKRESGLHLKLIDTGTHTLIHQNTMKLKTSGFFPKDIVKQVYFFSHGFYLLTSQRDEKKNSTVDVLKLDSELNVLWRWNTAQLIQNDPFFSEAFSGGDLRSRIDSSISTDKSLSLFICQSASIGRTGETFRKRSDIYFIRLDSNGSLSLNHKIDSLPDTDYVTHVNILPAINDKEIHCTLKDHKKHVTWHYKVSTTGKDPEKNIWKGPSPRYSHHVLQHGLALHEEKGLTDRKGEPHFRFRTYSLWDTTQIPWKKQSTKKIPVPWSSLTTQELKKLGFRTMPYVREAYNFLSVGDDILLVKGCTGSKKVPDSDVNAGLILFDKNFHKKSQLFLPFQNEPAHAAMRHVSLTGTTIKLKGPYLNGRKTLFEKEILLNVKRLSRNKLALLSFVREKKESFFCKTLSRSDSRSCDFYVLTILDLKDIVSGKRTQLSAGMIKQISIFTAQEKKLIHPPQD